MVHPLINSVRQRISANTYLPRCTYSVTPFPRRNVSGDGLMDACAPERLPSGSTRGMYKGHHRHAQAHRHDLWLFTAKPTESRCPQSRKEKFHPELQLGLSYCLLSEGSLFPCYQLRNVPYDHTLLSRKSGWRLDLCAIETLKLKIKFGFIYLFVCWECNRWVQSLQLTATRRPILLA